MSDILNKIIAVKREEVAAALESGAAKVRLQQFTSLTQQIAA